MPVSYTHLDVYKRQPGNNTPIAITVTIANNRPYAFANVVSPKPFSM